MKRITFEPPLRGRKEDRWTMLLDNQPVAIVLNRCALEAIEAALSHCAYVAPPRSRAVFRIEES
jgi:hypothetical protein